GGTPSNPHAGWCGGSGFNPRSYPIRLEILRTGGGLPRVAGARQSCFGGASLLQGNTNVRVRWVDSLLEVDWIYFGSNQGRDPSQRSRESRPNRKDSPRRSR